MNEQIQNWLRLNGFTESYRDDEYVEYERETQALNGLFEETFMMTTNRYVYSANIGADLLVYRETFNVDDMMTHLDNNV